MRREGAMVFATLNSAVAISFRVASMEVAPPKGADAYVVFRDLPNGEVGEFLSWEAA